MPKKNRDLVDALHEMAEGIPSEEALDKSAIREIEDMAGEIEVPSAASIEAMSELRAGRGRSFASLEDFLADLKDD